MISNLNQDSIHVDFSSVNPDDTTHYCDIWLEHYVIYSSLEYGISALPVVINAFVVFLFQNLIPLGKFYSKNGETETMFILITLFQFANLALLDILLNFKVRNQFLNSFSVFNGLYDDFTVEWYKIVGSSLCLTMFLNVFISQLGGLQKYLLHSILRCYDRGGCFKPIRKFPKPRNEVNTKKKMQS